MSREEASSPASTTESVCITSAIDVKGKCEVALIYAPNTFIKTPLNYKRTDGLQHSAQGQKTQMREIGIN